MVERIYAVEVSGACNLEATCSWCPMHSRPRYRKRGLMTKSVVDRALDWVDAHKKIDALALHVFGEPLLHPKFDEIALEFSKLTPITMSTNGVLMTEAWADRLAKVPWAWITLSPWDESAQMRAARLLAARDIKFQFPPGITHDFAGQAKTGPKRVLFQGCPFLNEKKAVIRWDGSIASCCITDREEDVIGHVFDEVGTVTMRSYDICSTCHHAL